MHLLIERVATPGYSWMRRKNA